MATCPVQWWTVLKGGDPGTDQATMETTRTPGLASRRDCVLTATRVKKSAFLPAWVLHQGKGPQFVKGKGPNDPGVEAPLHFAQSLGHWRAKARKVLEVVVRRNLSVLPFCLFRPSCLTFPLGVCIADENLPLVSPFLCWLVGKKCLEVPSMAAPLLRASPGLLRRIVF